MKKNPYNFFCRAICVSCFFFVLISCASDSQTVPPNYDYIIGKNFSESIPKARYVYQKVRETDVVEEYEWRRNEDGCILVFGVGKRDDIIEYWRVDSGLDTCKSKPPRPNM